MNKEIRTTPSAIKGVVYLSGWKSPQKEKNNQEKDAPEVELPIFQQKINLIIQKISAIREEIPHKIEIFAEELDKLEVILENFFERKNR